MRFIRPLRLIAAVLVLSSCSEPSAPRTPSSIAVVSGSGQAAAVATTLPQPVVAEVTDADGRPVRNVVVTWAVVEGGGSLNRLTSPTDRLGRAQTVWTLGTTAGVNRVTATVTGVPSASAAANARAGAPASILMVSGTAQTGMVNTRLTQPIVARVIDAHSNAVVDAPVTFTVSSGSVQPAATRTNATGLAGTAWTLGPDVGEQTLDAQLDGSAAVIRYTASAQPAPVVVDIENDVPVPALASEAGANRVYKLAVPENVTRLTVSLAAGSGDADLFVRHGELPSTANHDCRSISPTAAESCIVQRPASGDWYILIHAYTAYSDVTLRALYVVGGSLGVAVQGLPQSVEAAVTVTGPGSYTHTVSASETLTALLPGGYVITAPNVLAAGVVYVADPGSQQVNVASGARTDASVAYGESSGGLNLDVTGMYVTQSVQRPDGSVPLIAGRDGLVRVFARANAINSLSPAVRLRVYHGGTLVDTRTIAATVPAVPVAGDEDTLETTWNVLLPGSLIQPGLALLADVDPTDDVAETDEADNVFPGSGTPLAVTVVHAPVLEARFVPVWQAPNELVGDVTSANVSSYITTAHAMFPVPSIDADVRAPYSFSAVLPAQYDTVWGRLLSEIRTLRDVDSSTRHYYGVVKPAYTSGGTGLGYIALPAAVGVEWPNWRAETVAHEWGHNFGRFHVACGNPSNPDPNYPYTDRPGALGRNGFDLRSSALRSRHTHQDLMSYCQPTWVSDYTYEGILDFRAAAASAAPAEPVLLVWGRITADGLVLEPVFEVTARAALPHKAGAYRLTGRDAAGSEILSLSFEAHAIDHLPEQRHFSFSIPARLLRGRTLAELAVSGPAGSAVRRAAPATDPGVSIIREGADQIRVRWDAARSPALIVRDVDTGVVLSFARGGDARIATRAPRVEVNASSGLGSSARRITVEQ